MFLIIVISLFVICLVADIFWIKSDEGILFATGMIGLVLAGIIFGGFVLSHSSNIGIIREQSAVIKVYEDKVVRLKDDLNIITGKDKDKQIPYSLLNADSPVKTIVEQLAKSENDLAEARKTLAQARVCIAARKAGPFWPVVWIYGDK